MKKIVVYLRQLAIHNNKQWFDAHKDQYLEARTRFEEIVAQLLDGIQVFDPSLEGVQVKDCTYRIYKDMRFSKDGLPYKTHFGAYMVRGGKKSGYSGYYFHIGTGLGSGYPDSSFLAVGNYYTDPKVLKILREDIEYGNGDFDGIIKGLDPIWSLDQDQKLKRVPVGFHPDSPYIDYIKLKNYCLTGNLDDSAFDSVRILQAFRSAKPFLDYINRAIEYQRENQF